MENACWRAPMRPVRPTGGCISSDGLVLGLVK